MATADDPSLEVAAILRLGLGAALASSAAAAPGEPLLDALVRSGALRKGQAIAVQEYVARRRVVCACGQAALAPDGDAPFACGKCGGALARAASDGGPAARPGSSSALERALQIGSRIGPLELVQLLGAGAFGRVYKARHVELGRLCALKVIVGGASDDHRRKRFEREVVAQARLDHPGIVKIHATYAIGSALACEMELIDGADLRSRLQSGGALDWKSAATLVASVARAIDHAHERGVIHRDLKPENIMIRRDGTPVVADLGLARFVDQASSLTREGAVLGTPHYIAPETINGRRGEAACDVYALGVILYELIAGTTPFQATTPIELYVKISQGECEPLSPRVAPPALERVRARAMAVDPRVRHVRARDLAADLEAVLSGREPSRAPTSIAWRRWSSLVAVAVLAMAATVAVLRRPPPPEPRTPPPPVLSADVRARDALTRAHDLAPSDRNKARELLASEAETIAAVTSVVPHAAELLFELGDAARARALLEKLEPSTLAPPVRFLLARVLRATDDRERALALLKEKEGREGILQVAILLELGRLDEAEALSLALLDHGDARQKHDALVARGTVLLAKDDVTGALAVFDKANKLEDKNVGDSVNAFAEVELRIGARRSAPLMAAHLVEVRPRDDWNELVCAGAALLSGDAGPIRELAAGRSTAPRSIFACPDGLALVRDVRDRAPRGRWARQLLRDGRVTAARFDSDGHDNEDADSLSRSACDIFPVSTAAVTNRALFERLASLWWKNPAGALPAAEKARALSPRDRVARYLWADVMCRTKGDTAEALWPDDAMPDELAASELKVHSPCADPGRLLVERVRLALERKDLDGTVALAARLASLPGADVSDRRWACFYTREAESSRGRADAAARAETESWVVTNPWMDATAASILESRTRDLPLVDERLGKEPWLPSWRSIRGELRRAEIRDDIGGIHDLAIAGLADARYAPAMLATMLSPPRDVATGRVPSAPQRGTFGDPGPRAFAPSERPIDRAAVALARAACVLSWARTTNEAELYPRIVRALQLAAEAEEQAPDAPLPLAVRAIALDRIGSADAEHAHELVKKIAGDELELSTRVVVGELGGRRDVASIDSLVLAYRARAATEELFLRDLTGVETILEKSGRFTRPDQFLFFHCPSRLVVQGCADADSLVVVDGESLLAPTKKRPRLEVKTYPATCELELLLPGGTASIVVTDLDAGTSVEVPFSPTPAGGARRRVLVRGRVPPVLQPRLAIETRNGETFALAAIVYRLKPGTIGSENLGKHFTELDARVNGKSTMPAAEGARSLSEEVVEWLARRPEEPDAFVDLVFDRLLQRGPRPEERDEWLKRLESKACDRTHFVRAIARSLEFKNRYPE